MENKLSIYLSLIIIILILFSIVVGLKKNEYIECIKWDGYAKLFPHYESMKWQIEQCEGYNMLISREIYSN